MKQSILDITAKYEVAHGNTADLLGQLTAKATKLEKLKAKLGMSTSLSAFLELNELKEESEDEEELLFQGTYVSGSKTCNVGEELLFQGTYVSGSKPCNVEEELLFQGTHVSGSKPCNVEEELLF